MSAVSYCSHYLPQVLLTPVANLLLVSLIPAAIFHRYQQRQWYQWHQCSWHRHWNPWCTFTCESLRKFWKIFDMTLSLNQWTSYNWGLQWWPPPLSCSCLPAVLCLHENWYSLAQEKLLLEGTVPQDFRLQVSFMNQIPSSTGIYH